MEGEVEGGGRGGGGGVVVVKVTSVFYSYFVLTEYIYSYDVVRLYYVKFVYENDILMRN